MAYQLHVIGDLVQKMAFRFKILHYQTGVETTIEDMMH